jgi:hypothetical protein
VFAALRDVSNVSAACMPGNVVLAPIVLGSALLFGSPPSP